MREHVKAHGPRGRTIMQGIGIHTNEKTGLHLLNPGRPSQVVLSRPHTRSFTKPTSQPTSTTATSPVAAPVPLSRPHTRSFTKPTSQPTSTTATPPVVALVSASSVSDATATVSPEERLPKLTIKRHPPKN
ncbi:hypothetical protein V6N13_090317 [Hibiscus sabdariffa]|uniref:Uncharacterized protein n=1 Tax=Hibiscus sabdariffa TaxID=183260 RepID=A0ABR2C0N2_9ROSI